MGRYKTLAINTAIFGICNFTSKLLVFVMLPFYTAVLTTEEFGFADLLTTTVGLLTPFLSIEIANAAMRFAMDKNKSDKQVFSIGAIVIFAGFILLCCLLPILNRFIPMKGYEILFMLLYLLTVLDTFLGLFARGKELVRLVGIAAVVGSFTVVISNILLLFVFKLGVKGYILSMVIAHGVSCLLLLFKGNLFSYITIKVEKGLFSEMARYALPLIPNDISWWINQSSSRYFLNAYASLGDVGLFSAASKIPTIMDTFRGIFVSAWQISTISEYEKDDLNAFFSTVYRAYTVFLLSVSSILLLLSKLIARILYSNAFFEAWVYAPLLLLAVFFGSLVSFYSPLYLAHKNTRRLFVFTLLGAIVMLLSCWILVPRYGLYGASVSSVLSYCTIFFTIAWDTKEHLNIRLNNGKLSLSTVLLVVQATAISLFHLSPLGPFSVACSFSIAIINSKTIIEIFNKLLLRIRHRSK